MTVFCVVLFCTFLNINQFLNFWNRKHWIPKIQIDAISWIYVQKFDMIWFFKEAVELYRYYHSNLRKGSKLNYVCESEEGS